MKVARFHISLGVVVAPLKDIVVSAMEDGSFRMLFGNLVLDLLNSESLQCLEAIKHVIELLCDLIHVALEC